MENTLNKMLKCQENLQNRLGADFNFMLLEERAMFIKEMSYFVTEELHEMTREIPYVKSWSKKYDSWDEEKIKDQYSKAKEEFIDVITFALNIALALGMDGKEIEEMYYEKNEINHKRQNSNY